MPCGREAAWAPRARKPTYVFQDRRVIQSKYKNLNRKQIELNLNILESNLNIEIKSENNIEMKIKLNRNISHSICRQISFHFVFFFVFSSAAPLT